MPTTQKPPSGPQRLSLKELNAKLSQEVKELRRERDESLAREAATSDILRMIAHWPIDIQPVLDAIAERAARLCDAEDAAIFRVDGNFLRLVAHFGPIPMADAVGESFVIDRDQPASRAIADRQTIHVHDLRAAETEFPGAKTRGIAVGVCTVLSTPLLCEGIAIGTIHIRRREMHPFSDRQIKVLETFADQAVIAIENARLFQELTHKTADLEITNSELRESLEQQTATSEILGVIASSPTDVQPVLDVVAENAARLCESDDAVIRRLDGDTLRRVAHFGSLPTVDEDENYIVSRAMAAGRAVLAKETIHVHDVLAEMNTEYARSRPWYRDTGTRTVLATPLLRESVPVGVIVIRRTEVRPFTDKQIALLKTFADQAVIAIENVRLFNELKESLEQQTATSEILGVIASSPTEIEPVFQTILANAIRLCEAKNGVVFRFDGEVFRTVVRRDVSSALRAYVENMPLRPGRESAVRRVGLEKRPVHIPDILADPECVVPEAYKDEGMRTSLAVPLLKEDNLIGAIAIWRREVRPFTDAHIKLVSTLADQAVIAIENVRLFKELQERNAELREALEHQTATSEVLGIISRSPTDVQPVLDAIVESAARVCGIDNLGLRLREGNKLVSRAQFGRVPPGRDEMSVDEPAPRWIREHGTLHVPDVREHDF